MQNKTLNEIVFGKIYKTKVLEKITFFRKEQKYEKNYLNEF